MDVEEMIALLPEHWRSRVGDPVGRQRLIEEGERLLVILHEVPGEKERDLFFWREEDQSWSSAPLAGGLRHWRKLLDEYEVVVDRLEAKLKQARTVRDYYCILKEEAPVGRALKQVRLIASRTRKMCKKNPEILEIRSVAEELDHDLSLVQEEAKLGMEALAAESAENQREMGEQQAAYGLKLNRLAAFFLPLMAFGALFGMNVPNGLEASGWAFFAVFALGLTAGGVLVSLIGKE
ncbi:MAG: hypothetical protein ACQKBY_02630 [Verrucomicrobiales bacterium]